MSKELAFYQELVDYIIQEQNGELKGVKKKFGVSKKKAQQVLEEQGYSFNQQVGKWTNEHTEQFVDGFSNAEIDLLRELISDVQQKKDASTIEEASKLDELLQNVSDDAAPKVRRTFTVDEDIMQQFDAFCEDKGYTKSHIITIALKQFLDTYK
ncbi:MAG: hypothetical protein UHX00_07510 [Caryophanon sp.]|nr:hypothetical protein [Caryophanon sp.]